MSTAGSSIRLSRETSRRSLLKFRLWWLLVCLVVAFPFIYLPLRSTFRWMLGPTMLGPEVVGATTASVPKPKEQSDAIASSQPLPDHPAPATSQSDEWRFDLQLADDVVKAVQAKDDKNANAAATESRWSDPKQLFKTIGAKGVDQTILELRNEFDDPVAADLVNVLERSRHLLRLHPDRASQIIALAAVRAPSEAAIRLLNNELQQAGVAPILSAGVISDARLRTLRQRLSHPVDIHPTKSLFAAGISRDLVLIDSVTGKRLSSTRVFDDIPITSATYSPDGRHLVCGSSYHPLRILDTATNQFLSLPPEHLVLGTQVAFMDDSKRFVAVGQEIQRGMAKQNASLIDLTTTESQELTAESEDVQVVAIDSQSRSIFVGGWRNLLIYDANTLELVKTMSVPAAVRCLTCLPSGDLAVGLFNGDVRYWSSENKNWDGSRSFASGSKAIVSMDLIDADGRLAVLDGNGVLWICDLVKQQSRQFGWHRNGHQVLASSDGKTLATIGYQDGINLWRTPPPTDSDQPGRHWFSLSGIRQSPDGRWVVGVGKYVWVWDKSTGECKGMIRSQIDRIFDVAVSNDSSRLAITGDNPVTELWDLSTCEQVATFQGESSGEIPIVRQDWRNQSVVFGNDDQTLLVAENDVVRIYDVDEHAMVRQLVPPRMGSSFQRFSMIAAMATNAGQTQLFVAHSNHIRVWNLENGELVKTIDERFSTNYQNRKLLFSNKYELLALNGLSDVMIIDPNSGQRIDRFSRKRLLGVESDDWLVSDSDGTIYRCPITKQKRDPYRGPKPVFETLYIADGALTSFHNHANEQWSFIDQRGVPTVVGPNPGSSRKLHTDTGR